VEIVAAVVTASKTILVFVSVYIWRFGGI